MEPMAASRWLGGWRGVLYALLATLGLPARPLDARELLGGDYRLEAGDAWRAEVALQAAQDAGLEDRQGAEGIDPLQGPGAARSSSRASARSWTLVSEDGCEVSLVVRVASPASGSSELHAHLGAASLVGARWPQGGHDLVVTESRATRIGGTPTIRLLARCEESGRAGAASIQGAIESLQYVVYGPETLLLAFTFHAAQASGVLPAVDRLASRLQVQGEGGRTASVPSWMCAGLLGLLGGALSAARRLRP